MRWIHPDDSEISREAVENLAVEGRNRAIVDHDHFIILSIDVSLVTGRQRVKGAGCLARHVVDNNDDRDFGLARLDTRHSLQSCVDSRSCPAPLTGEAQQTRNVKAVVS